ncbi:MutS-related protein [Spirochaeta dissipatitropha]
MGDTASAELRLLYPAGKKSSGHEISKLSLSDLAVDRLARAICRSGPDHESVVKILGRLETDPGIIEYRQAVFHDLMNYPQLCAAIEEAIPLIDEITRFVRTARESDAPLLTAVWRIGELEMYSDAVNILGDCFESLSSPPKSEGLIALSEKIREIRQDAAFQSLQKELPHLLAGIRRRKSLTIGVNLDDKLRPVEATILSVNEQAFTEGSILGGFLKQVKPEFRTHAPIHQTLKNAQGQYSTQVPLAPMFADLNEILKSLIKPMNRTLESYLSLNTAFLRELRQDFSFFLGGLKLMQRLQDAGISCCFPSIEASGSNTVISDFVNLQLALTASEKSREPMQLIPNDALFDHNAGYYLLTGPNQGGKTTYIQGLALVFICAQAGLFAPASSARIVPADHVLTHFPSEERGALTTGRLSEELERLDEIFQAVSPNSLVLLNETFSSTSPGEASRLAEDIVLGLRMIGARGVFATHLHELALRIPELNSMVDGPSPIASLVAQISAHSGKEEEAAERSFRIVRAEPEGRSFALDIARKYRLSLEDLQERLKLD